MADVVSVRFKKGMTKRLREVADTLHFGISISDLVREYVITALISEELQLPEKRRKKYDTEDSKLKRKEVL